MTFNSLEFGLFIALVLAGYAVIYRRETARDVFLLISSYLFYSAWYWEYAGLIALSTLTDWILVRFMVGARTNAGRKLCLILSLVVNLGLLSFFKYFNFFSDAVHDALFVFGMDLSLLRHDLLLPVGISFYTFQTLSYTIDVYRRKLEPETSLLKFAVFVSFFPQLVAGPIVRAADFLPQLRQKITISSLQIGVGAFLICAGLFKKIVIADSLALLGVDAVFGAPGSYSAADLWAGLYGYAFQIYCDFSGYSDIAIGLALMMGFRLPINFNRPYLAADPSDFWRRWHISLSSWLRDYLYISLGGSRSGSIFTARNLMLTMLLGGLWHGAAWTFVIWGMMHGLYLIAYRPFRDALDPKGWRRWLLIFVTFHLIVLTWLPFRSADIEHALTFARGLVPSGTGPEMILSLSPMFYGLVIFAALLHFVPVSWLKARLQSFMADRSFVFQSIVYAGFLILFLGFSIDAPQFIYFQF